MFEWKMIIIEINTYKPLIKYLNFCSPFTNRHMTSSRNEIVLIELNLINSNAKNVS